MQWTTATVSLLSSSFIPNMRAMFFLFAGDVGLQADSLASPLNSASANASQPAYPQPPQLAPDRLRAISSMRGSRSTDHLFT